MYNMLPMDPDIRERVEVRHFSKCLELDHAFRSWYPQPLQWAVDVSNHLDQVNNQWLNADTDQRPADEDDVRSCDSPAWKEMLERLHSSAKATFQGTSTVLGKARKLML